MVAINGGTLNLVTNIPLNIPIRIPITKVIKIITGTEGKIVIPKKPRTIPSKIKPPAIIPLNPITEPMERSMPPVKITKVIPMATIAFRATCRIMVSMLVVVRKC
jgi:hypothetical protein